MFKNNPYLVYILKFTGAFCILYFGTKAIIGITVPGGYYSHWVEHYVNYPKLLRDSLLHGTRILVKLFGMETYLRDAYHVTMVGGRGVRIVYACLGYGLFSFWTAFIYANKGSFLKKLKWILGGCVLIWFINVARISLVLVATNRRWKPLFTMDQHTLFTIVVYAFIFLMIWRFQRSGEKEEEILDT